MREEEQGWDDYLINCCFKGIVGIFLQCTPLLISNLLPWEEFARAWSRASTLDHTDSEALSCQGTGRGSLETEETA